MNKRDKEKLEDIKIADEFAGKMRSYLFKSMCDYETLSGARGLSKKDKKNLEMFERHILDARSVLADLSHSLWLQKEKVYERNLKHL